MLHPEAEHGDRTREHHAEVSVRVLEERHRCPAVVRFTREHHLQILTPAIRDHDIADVEARIHAAGNTGEHHIPDGEMVKRQLRRHRRVDDTDSAQEEHDFVPFQGARAEDDTVHRELRCVFQVALQNRQFRRESRDDGDARRVVPNRVRVGRPWLSNREKQQDEKTGDQGSAGNETAC